MSTRMSAAIRAVIAFSKKAAINNLSDTDLAAYRDGDGLSMEKGACAYADAIAIGSESVDANVDYLSVAQDKPILPWTSEENFLTSSLDFIAN